MIASETGADHTEAMRSFACARTRQLQALDLCGYVFKKSSPSCGIADVPVAGQAAAARGLFAEELLRLLPDIPVAEEPDLRTQAARNRFIDRVLDYSRRRSRA